MASTSPPALGPTVAMTLARDVDLGAASQPPSSGQNTRQLYLPALSDARNSTSSLMAAVFSDTQGPTTQPNMADPPHAAKQRGAAPSAYPSSASYKKRQTQASVSRTPSTQSWNQSATDTESWDVLSDAESRLNEGDKEGEREEVVAELQKKVDRRKSQLPQLESQLAELEAQIKAAEERLAKAQIAQQSASAPISMS